MKKENDILSSLIIALMKEKKPLWRKVAKELSRSRRDKVEVNLDKLNAFAADGSTVVVPGKVLGTGGLGKKITVAAFDFSRTARQLINSAGGKAMSIDALLRAGHSGKDIVLIK